MAEFDENVGVHIEVLIADCDLGSPVDPRMSYLAKSRSSVVDSDGAALYRLRSV